MSFLDIIPNQNMNIHINTNINTYTHMHAGINVFLSYKIREKIPRHGKIKSPNLEKH